VVTTTTTTLAIEAPAPEPPVVEAPAVEAPQPRLRGEVQNEAPAQGPTTTIPLPKIGKAPEASEGE
jgi:hypothetical protein